MKNAFKFLILGLGIAYLLYQTSWGLFLEKIISLRLIHQLFDFNALLSMFFISSIPAFILVWFFKLHRRYSLNLGFLLIFSSVFLYFLMNLNKLQLFSYFARTQNIIGYSSFTLYFEAFFNILIFIGFFYIFLSNPSPLFEKSAEDLSE